MSNQQPTHFPDGRQEALAILYMQNQDLSGKTPEEIVDMYDDVYKRICDRFLTIKGKQPRFNKDNL